MLCNLAAWDDALLNENPNKKQMWNDAWVYIGPCELVSLEEVLEQELTNRE